jgi:hypothetical protein
VLHGKRRYHQLGVATVGWRRQVIFLDREYADIDGPKLVT